MPSVAFLLPGGRRVDVLVPRGASVLEAARLGDVAVEGACGGSMACATCHVHVIDPPAWLDAPAPEEEDMLDLARDLRATSRLGCQLRLRGKTAALTVSVPPSTLLE